MPLSCLAVVIYPVVAASAAVFLTIALRNFRRRVLSKASQACGDPSSAALA